MLKEKKILVKTADYGKRRFYSVCDVLTQLNWHILWFISHSISSVSKIEKAIDEDWQTNPAIVMQKAKRMIFV